MRIIMMSLIVVTLLVGYSSTVLPDQKTHANSNLANGQTVQPLAADTSKNVSKSADRDNTQSILPDTILDFYYEGQADPAFAYFQHTSIQRFAAMWVKKEIEDIETPIWNFDSFTQISMLDHDFVESHPDEAIYCCTFSDGAGRFGYLIMKYDASDPSLSNWGVQETTPYLYDLKANMKEIGASLLQTDIDLSTAKASRVYLFDREKNRANQVIRFTDGKGDDYICDLGNSSFEIEKW